MKDLCLRCGRAAASHSRPHWPWWSKGQCKAALYVHICMLGSSLHYLGRFLFFKKSVESGICNEPSLYLALKGGNVFKCVCAWDGVGSKLFILHRNGRILCIHDIWSPTPSKSRQPQRHKERKLIVKKYSVLLNLLLVAKSKEKLQTN